MGKPHCMFFDECYSEHYYRAETVRDFTMNEADCLLVIGTALQTGLAMSTVREFLAQKKTVIELNMEGDIQWGKRYFVEGKAEVTVKEMVTEYLRLRAIKKR